MTIEEKIEMAKRSFARAQRKAEQALSFFEKDPLSEHLVWKLQHAILVKKDCEHALLHWEEHLRKMVQE